MQNQALQKLYEAAPETIRNFLATNGFQALLARIATQNQLRPDQGVIFENEVILTLLDGDTSNFPKKLNEQLSLSVEQVDKLVSDVNVDVFSVVRNELIQMQHENDLAEQTAAPTPTIPHSSLEQSIEKRLQETVRAPREERELPVTQDPYREPIE